MKISSILITGGTGSFGQMFVRKTLCDVPAYDRIVIFSRDEVKQLQMRQELEREFPNDASRLRFFIGDVRDQDRLRRALNGIDVVVHAAALKQVPALEYNPTEAVKTNILGALNVIDEAVDAGVKKVIALSSDKACAPINLYGATKMVMEKLVVQANNYSHQTRFACVRYGNVIGSRGSVVPLWQEQSKRGEITMTDPDMTRYLITLEQGVAFVRSCLERMQGGEVFVPMLPSAYIGTLAQAVAPAARVKMIGMRGGEKRHEWLVAPDEAPFARRLDDCYVLYPAVRGWQMEERGARVPNDFCYSSASSGNFMTAEEIQRWLNHSS